MASLTWDLSDDRYFGPEPGQKKVAQDLYATVADLPLVCPHGHVDPYLFVDEDASFGTPADLFIIPDHYVFRVLYAHGISLEDLGLPRLDGRSVEGDHRRIWQVFADHFYLFRGMPSGLWLSDELSTVFGISEKLTSESAQAIYDAVSAKLQSPAFKPRALFDRFDIEVLCTTDSAGDLLRAHRAIQDSGWNGTILPTFRPDAVINLHSANWHEEIEKLGMASGIAVHSYKSFVQALEDRRAFFKSMGAVSADHSAQSAFTTELSDQDADAIFQRALRGDASVDDARRFTGHMLIESARMSIGDGLVMQFHSGILRNHNKALFELFGPDRGSDIPVTAEFTQNLCPLLNRFGSDSRLTLIVFTLDEATYSRELAPLAGHYPALKIGPPWWFQDSVNGIARYLESVVEIAGLYNTVGFNDDTRAFPSIPARHDVWRRVCSNWLAGLLVRGVVDEYDAHEMILDLSYRLAKKAYHLGE